MNLLLDDEAESVAAQFFSGSRRVLLKKSIPDSVLSVEGTPHLLRRMIRNALENAFSFAKSEVRVTLLEDPGQEARILVEDDGAGFSQEALASYGERRVSRRVEGRRSDRVSLGLGSVIIQSVARMHRGKAEPANRIVEDAIQGASVKIVLPLFSAE